MLFIHCLVFSIVLFVLIMAAAASVRDLYRFVCEKAMPRLKIKNKTRRKDQ
jgi:hypothetical protein